MAEWKARNDRHMMDVSVHFEQFTAWRRKCNEVVDLQHVV
jgi:hypothetical protein